MKYRRIISLFVAAALLPLSQAQARPHFDGPDRDDDRREHHHHHRDRDRIYYPGPVRVYPGPVHMYAPPVRYTRIQIISATVMDWRRGEASC